MAVITSPLIYLAVYLTNWALLLSLALTLLVLKCSIDPHSKAKKGWLAATHIFFELATVINVVVVPVYWGTIHSTSIKNYEHNTMMWVHQYLVHLFPSLAVLVIFLTTDLKIKAGHAKVFPVIALLFGVVNCYHVRKTGQPTYWFLTWEDYTSPLVIFTLLCITTAWFVGMARLTEVLKTFKEEKKATSLIEQAQGQPYKKKRGCTRRFRRKAKKNKKPEVTSLVEFV